MTQQLPVTIICGFLGAGKTTLINHLLRNPESETLAVLVNDFGSINIDRELIKVEAKNQIELSNGCICCTIQDDLVAGLISLTRMGQSFTRVIVECSGVSHPAGVLKIFETETVERLFTVDGVFCLVDADAFPALDYQNTELVIDQAAMSDIVLLNKIDLASEDAVKETAATLLEAQSKMKIHYVEQAAIAPAILFGPAAPERSSATSLSPDNTHDNDFETAAFQWDASVNVGDFARMIEALPVTILRGKGILNLRGDDLDSRRGIFHLVGKRSSIDMAREPAPAESRMVLIARRGALNAPAVHAALALCPGARPYVPALKPSRMQTSLACN